MEYQVLPNYIDEILVDDSKAHMGLVKKANAILKEFNTGEHYEFVDGECSIEMEFYDGIALATDGSGLYLTYPTIQDVSKSIRMQERIQDYTGIYDGSINQHDIALAYGVLKFDKEKQKVSTSRNMRSLQHETLVLMSADIFQDVYNMSEIYDYNTAASLVRDAALRFEKKWWEMKADDKDDMLDYIFEMEKFETEELERLRKEYDSPAVFKTPITQA